MHQTKRLAHCSTSGFLFLVGIGSFAGAVACTPADRGVNPSDTCTANCGGGGPTAQGRDGGAEGAAEDGAPPGKPGDSGQNKGETDLGCGGLTSPPCAEGKKCLVDTDCVVACGYANTCVSARSCKPHLGGDTCGQGEVGQAGALHESCCRTLPVTGYADPRNPGKTVYLDKYEITAGRVRAFIKDITDKSQGKPDIRAWIGKNTPSIWDNAWNKFLPSSNESDTVHVDRNLLGDVRPNEPPLPDTDQDQKVGVNYQFNGQLFVYLHGNNCSTHEDAFGFPTFFYPASVLAMTGPGIFPPRANGTTPGGVMVPAAEHLDVKAMNCITNALLAAFCHWDSAQLATDDVLNFVTGSPATLGNAPGCGTQVGNEYYPRSDAATKGGRCADLTLINASFDAGGQLPEPGDPLNASNYIFPIFPDGTTHDKAWEIAAPGRGTIKAGGAQTDVVRLKDLDEPWVDLAGNLNESVLTMSGASFTGKFGLKFRGIGFQSARSELNFNANWPGEGGLRRIERPEAKAGFAGGRCMRFR